MAVIGTALVGFLMVAVVPKVTRFRISEKPACLASVMDRFTNAIGSLYSSASRGCKLSSS